MEKAPMTLDEAGTNTAANSIRYNLTFQEALLRFVDAQLEPEGNPDESSASPDQEKAQQLTFKQLCDVIDLYVERASL